MTGRYRINEEDLAVTFSGLLHYLSVDLGYPAFAGGLALAGMEPERLREHAAIWRADGFEPPALADSLELLADEVERETRGPLPEIPHPNDTKGQAT